MKTKRLFPFITMAIVVAPFVSTTGAQSIELGGVDFSTQRSPGEKCYRFVTEYIEFALDGARLSTEETILECAVTVDARGKQRLTCLKFEIKGKDGKILGIPKLMGWVNTLDNQTDELFGVKHADFQGLTTEDGPPLPPETIYRVYNTFVDFYAFNNVLAQPVRDSEKKSIAGLSSIGDEIEHHSAFSEPPTDLGETVGKGSYFKNGRVTLRWNGISMVNQRRCAIVGFDSGDSSFMLLMQPAPNQAMRVKGGSHYWGDLHLNLSDYWMEYATFKEFVTTQITVGENSPTATPLIMRLGTITLKH